MSVWLNWLCICFLSPIFELLDIWYWIEMCSWSRIRGEGNSSLLTQQEANMYSSVFSYSRALEPYQLRMTTKFAQVISILYYTAFYVILFPPGIVITIFGLLFQYWVTKVPSTDSLFST